jgi:hypothetical protein
MEKIRDIVIKLPPDNKQKIFYDFRTNLQLDWAEMEEIVQYIRRTKQIQVSLIQQMPFQAQLRLACYLLYDEINPVVYPPVVQKVPKVPKVKKGKKIELKIA